jgi:hypothetical protein
VPPEAYMFSIPRSTRVSQRHAGSSVSSPGGRVRQPATASTDAVPRNANPPSGETRGRYLKLRASTDRRVLAAQITLAEATVRHPASASPWIPPEAARLPAPPIRVPSASRKGTGALVAREFVNEPRRMAPDTVQVSVAQNATWAAVSAKPLASTRMSSVWPPVPVFWSGFAAPALTGLREIRATHDVLLLSGMLDGKPSTNSCDEGGQPLGGCTSRTVTSHRDVARRTTEGFTGRKAQFRLR